MSRYLPTPSPNPPMDAVPFWDWCRKRELRFQQCGSCGRHRHPPSPFCRFCGSDKVEWDPAPNEAELFSYTVVHNAVTEELKPYVPYNIAVVGFPSLQVRLISNIIDLPPSELRIGMPLRLTWQECDDSTPLPLFLGKIS
ncbi:OB-fold domain-containing protein [uncultured Sneathiella sp.]|uniref:Zn-ribbon domain-containing OB-fold protein n=1 Tax=uncultured Sneathiella sp. TaxID=879315 RepID=UPI0030EB2A68|tara:strand:- start:1552 stop:1971 length:420 start_codon:yes stop_codon:yes gene_type:complete